MSIDLFADLSDDLDLDDDDFVVEREGLSDDDKYVLTG